MAHSGMCARSVITTKARTLVSVGSSFSTSGTKLRSKNRTVSSAWLMMYSSCSGNRRGLTVCSTAPMPDTPKYSSMWR